MAPDISIAQPQSLGSLLERSGTTTYVVGILYLVSLIYSVRRFLKSCTNVWRWDIPRLFLASIVFGLLVRTFSFLTLAALALQKVQVQDDDATTSKDQIFYQRVLSVLFNVGDWAAFSTYLLLIVVWVEILQTARKHYYNQAAIRRHWMIAYLIINTSLYIVQIGLYTAIFTRQEGDENAILDAIYAVIAFVNFSLPAILSLAWCYYSIAFAGFPYRNERAKASLQRINRLIVGWTVGRLVWAIMAVLAAQDSMVQAIADVGDWLFALVVGTVFVLAELLPYLASLGSDVLILFVHPSQAVPSSPASHRALAAGLRMTALSPADEEDGLGGGGPSSPNSDQVYRQDMPHSALLSPSEGGQDDELLATAPGLALLPSPPSTVSRPTTTSTGGGTHQLPLRAPSSGRMERASGSSNSTPLHRAHSATGTLLSPATTASSGGVSSSSTPLLSPYGTRGTQHVTPPRRQHSESDTPASRARGSTLDNANAAAGKGPKLPIPELF